MMRKNIVRDGSFKRVDEVKLDSKNRITLGKKSRSFQAKFYVVYTNELGQIVLDPQATVPAYEQWLFNNEEAKNSVQRGLEQLKNNELLDADEDYSKYVDE